MTKETTMTTAAAIRKLDARTDALIRATRDELDAAEFFAAEFGSNAEIADRIGTLRERIRKLNEKAAGCYGLA